MKRTVNEESAIILGERREAYLRLRRMLHKSESIHVIRREPSVPMVLIGPPLHTTSAEFTSPIPEAKRVSVEHRKLNSLTRFHFGYLSISMAIRE